MTAQRSRPAGRSHARSGVEVGAAREHLEALLRAGVRGLVLRIEKRASAPIRHARAEAISPPLDRLMARSGRREVDVGACDPCDVLIVRAPPGAQMRLARIGFPAAFVTAPADAVGPAPDARPHEYWIVPPRGVRVEIERDDDTRRNLACLVTRFAGGDWRSARFRVAGALAGFGAAAVEIRRFKSGDCAAARAFLRKAARLTADQRKAIAALHASGVDPLSLVDAIALAHGDERQARAVAALIRTLDDAYAAPPGAPGAAPDAAVLLSGVAKIAFRAGAQVARVRQLVSLAVGASALKATIVDEIVYSALDDPGVRRAVERRARDYARANASMAAARAVSAAVRGADRSRRARR